MIVYEVQFKLQDKVVDSFRYGTYSYPVAQEIFDGLHRMSTHWKGWNRMELYQIQEYMTPTLKAAYERTI